MKERKIILLLEQRYSLFHADLILAAINDDSISDWDFIDGIQDIREREAYDDDEHVPVQFKHLVND